MVSTSIFLLSGLGLVAASVLAAASKVLHVEEDPRITAVESCFPGANCGGCGYPGCSAAAAAVVKGEAPPALCVAGGMEIAEAVAKVMGQSVAFKEPRLASLICTGGERANLMFDYSGARDCRAEAMLYGGDKACGLACLGLGSCVKACSFGAIELGAEGLPIINKALCRSCGKCAEVCPTGALRLKGLSTDLLHLNKLSDCLAPCMQKCPAQLDVRTMIQQLKNGEMGEALLTLKDHIALPAVVGRICPHGCETICRRQIVDEGVAINSLERYVADWEMGSGGRVPLQKNPDTGHKVSVVGGGAAGLSCAYFLARLGHEVHIFDSKDSLGGMVRHTIPEYRVPNRVMDWEVQGILELGVKARLGKTLGEHFSLESLKAEGFEAIFLATGAWKTPALDLPGEDSMDVVDGVEFLGRIVKDRPDLSGKRLVIIGDTNTAMDVARSAGRLGAYSVTVLSKHIKRKMQANNKEVDRAEELGTEILYKTVPTAIVPCEVGDMCVEYGQTEYKDPKKCSGEPLLQVGTEEQIECDLVINCVDRVPDLTPYVVQDGTSPFAITKKGTIDADNVTLETSVPGVFVGGELYSGRNVVVQAVADGRVAARSIHMLLTDGEIAKPVNPQQRVITESILKGMRVKYTIPRVEVPEISVGDRRSTFKEEVSLPLEKRLALKEASRCLRCGLTCYDAEAGSEYQDDEDVRLIEYEEKKDAE
ncbi:FAD-dependent oxidoreductase [Desulfovibrio ferrophilus]|uniref:Ion-translocating oxidoreductase complex subunit B n=1 Tax=Desulfovibrio ferrophilus TaxID=241368 RepID=A0A2Z6AW29_9BACT|nr:FAD-dependent oxidoreductase [Desulfovibrio ferrophilus]BBD07385.1 RnfABCDGE type electron transport complex subunit B [Desulfovibrio ferrophilus]